MNLHFIGRLRRPPLPLRPDGRRLLPAVLLLRRRLQAGVPLQGGLRGAGEGHGVRHGGQDVGEGQRDSRVSRFWGF